MSTTTMPPASPEPWKPTKRYEAGERTRVLLSLARSLTPVDLLELAVERLGAAYDAANQQAQREALDKIREIDRAIVDLTDNLKGKR